VCWLQVHLNEGAALARALEKLPRSLRRLKLTSLGGMRTAVPLGMQLQGLTQVTALTLASRWGCASSPSQASTLPAPLRRTACTSACKNPGAETWSALHHQSGSAITIRPLNECDECDPAMLPCLLRHPTQHFNDGRHAVQSRLPSAWLVVKIGAATCCMHHSTTHHASLHERPRAVHA